MLESYLAARSKGNILSEVMAMVDEGVSARGSQRLTGRALSSSEVSRQWVKHSARRIEELRGRDLSKDEYFGLMTDSGIPCKKWSEIPQNQNLHSWEPLTHWPKSSIGHLGKRGEAVDVEAEGNLVRTGTLNKIEFREVAKFKITFFFVRNPDRMANGRLPLVVQDFKYEEHSL